MCACAYWVVSLGTSHRRLPGTADGPRPVWSHSTRDLAHCPKATAVSPREKIMCYSGRWLNYVCACGKATQPRWFVCPALMRLNQRMHGSSCDSWTITSLEEQVENCCGLYRFMLYCSKLHLYPHKPCPSLPTRGHNTCKHSSPRFLGFIGFRSAKFGR